MQLSYGQVKERSAAVAAAIAAERSARNLASRRRAEDARDEREARQFRRRRKRKEAEDLKIRRQRLRVRMPQEDRPKTGNSTARKLFHRTADMLFGTTGLTDARGPDGLYSVHFSFTARGFASTTGRRWRNGEAERAALYIVREDGLEGGEHGWWSNIAADRNELAAFYRTSEAIERHDRSNANVYVAEIISLPHELSARQRRKAVRRICRFFNKRGLPYTIALHLPDRAGDQRNYHVHIIYSLRPCERHDPYDWSFGVGKEADINTPAGIKERRLAVVQAINTTLCAAGIAKRYTHLSNRARGMAAGQAKIGQEATWIVRRLEALEKRADQLQQLSAMVRNVRDILGRTGLTLQRQRLVTVERLRDLQHGVETAAANDRTVDLEAAVRAHLSSRALRVRDANGALEKRIHAVGYQTDHAVRREKLSELRRLFVGATRSLQTNQAATDERLQDIGNRIRASFAESSERNIRLAALGAKARK
ncbi:MAG: MobA/MobL family protein, partial [Sphingopyxis sp.]|nr:MobA/MobL family protein [Sphingopyxis sp.]